MPDPDPPALQAPAVEATPAQEPTTAKKQQGDYTTWATHALISRIEALEARLRSLNDTAPAAGAVKAASKQRRAQQQQRPFDAAKYTTRHIALKFAYLGQGYNGFEHHDNNTTALPTIEEEIWKALVKTKLIFKDAPADARPGNVKLDWDGCDYSKCGRTDKGVSAFGQVVGLRVRSAQPRDAAAAAAWDPIHAELAYPRLLNRVLPPDIRILAWCPSPHAAFSARFDCRERRYRYFFTQPCVVPVAGPPGVAPPAGERTGWLDIAAMRRAAAYYLGERDFRNLCKLDPAKQIHNFRREIRRAEIVELAPHDPVALAFLRDHHVQPVHADAAPAVYYFEVHGNAFLWHQVRHMVALLFLVGQRLEPPEIVRDLLDVDKCPTKPFYEMADDAPLVLWDCIFPAAPDSDPGPETPLQDGLPWVHVDGQDASAIAAAGDGRYGPGGINEVLWSTWRKRKMDEILARGLLDLVGGQSARTASCDGPDGKPSARVFDGGDVPRWVGPYTPVFQRRRMEDVRVQNARYAERKGLVPRNDTP